MVRWAGIKCSAEGCDRDVRARGLCITHYQSAHHNGSLVPLRPGTSIYVEPSVTCQVSEQDRIYFAGYFDGEGCVYVDKRSYRHSRNTDYGHWPLHVTFKQTVPGVVQSMRKLYGGHLRIEIPAPERPKFRISLKWDLTRTVDALRFLRDIQPFVREKRPQVDLVLQKYKTPMNTQEGTELREILSAMKHVELSVDEILRAEGNISVYQRRLKPKREA